MQRTSSIDSPAPPGTAAPRPAPSTAGRVVIRDDGPTGDPTAVLDRAVKAARRERRAMRTRVGVAP